MDPQQYRGIFNVDTDIYATGMTFLHMMLGTAEQLRRVLDGRGDPTSPFIYKRHLVREIRADLEEDDTTSSILNLINKM